MRSCSCGAEHRGGALTCAQAQVLIDAMIDMWATPRIERLRGRIEALDSVETASAAELLAVVDFARPRLMRSGDGYELLEQVENKLIDEL